MTVKQDFIEDIRQHARYMLGENPTDGNAAIILGLVANAIRERDAERTEEGVKVPVETLLRWAAVATLADSYMSLVYHRGGIREWDTSAVPPVNDWLEAMHKARRASDQMRALLRDQGVDDHAIAREMDRPSWETRKVGR